MFRLLKICFYLFIAWALFGCVGAETVTRSSTPDPAPVLTRDVPDFGDAELIVTVPQGLTVSESNVLRPVADIVWREGPAGDRHGQVQALVAQAIAPVTAALEGRTPVRIEIEVMRFHTLSDRARYTVGGTHEIAFLLRVTQRETGQVLLPPRRVDLNLEAYGGRRAIEAEEAGQTQSVRITEHLRAWARDTFGLRG